MLKSLGLYSKLNQKATAALSRLDFEINRLDARASAVEMSDLANISQEVNFNIETMFSNIDAPDEGTYSVQEHRELQTYRGR